MNAEADRPLLSRPHDYVAAEFYAVAGDLVLTKREGPAPRARGFSFAAADKSLKVRRGILDAHLTWPLPPGEGEGRVRLHLRLKLDPQAPEMVAEVMSLEFPPGYRMVELQWPRGLRSVSDGAGDLVWPLASGVVLPLREHPSLRLRLPAHARLPYMPWIGLTAGPEAAMLLLETPVDGAVDMYYEKREASVLAPIWRASLGELHKPRRARFVFLSDGGDHVAMAKRYRQSDVGRGDFVPLSKKLARLPQARNFTGGVLLSMQALWIDPKTESRVLKNTFAYMAAMLRAAHGQGVRNLVLHADGWGRDGYDRLHPQPYPPGVEAGGWKGLRELADTARELGYLLLLHDNYHMYNLATPGFDWERAIHTWSGERPHLTTWGAPQSILAEPFALPFLKANLKRLAEAEVKVGGLYLDEYGIVELYESYHPNARMRRADSLRHRVGLFKELGRRGLAATTEEPVDWVVPHIVAPFWARMPEWMGWKWMDNAAVQAPLLHLVYGDSIVIPRALKGEADTLTALLYAEIANVQLYQPTRDSDVGFYDKSTVALTQRVAASQTRLAGVEMVAHRYLGPERLVQETVFANGTTIRVDFKSKAVEVKQEKR